MNSNQLYNSSSHVLTHLDSVNIDGIYENQKNESGLKPPQIDFASLCYGDQSNLTNKKDQSIYFFLFFSFRK